MVTKVDLYGSRYSLIPLMRNQMKLNIDINKAYLGSSLFSQYAKTRRIDYRRIDNRLNKYEELEVMNDNLKLFRRFVNHTRSTVIVIDFLYEGTEVVNTEEGRITCTNSNIKYEKNLELNKNLSFNSKLNSIDNNLKNFINDLSKFDIVIINQLRNPKYKIENNTSVLKPDVSSINMSNSIIESFEDLLFNKLNTVKVIPLFEKHNEEGYWFTSEYIEHFVKYLERIIND